MKREIIYSAKVKIEGITKLVQHRCGVIDTQKKKSKSEDYSREWMETTYIDDNGFVCVPGMNLEAMMRDGSRGEKIGKISLSRIIPSGTAVREFEVPVKIDGKTITLKDIESEDWILKASVVVNRFRIARMRTALPVGWEVTFTVDVYDARIKPEILNELLDEAGIKEGLMDWRPGAKKPGKFGQFEVVSFEVI